MSMSNETWKVTPAAFASFARTLKPDIVFTLPDIPFTPPPYSQKRVIKSIERTHRWLTDALISQRAAKEDSDEAPRNPAIFGHLLGGSTPQARSAFSEGLLEPFDGKQVTLLPHLSNLDEALDGYVLDIVPIRLALGEFAKGQGALAQLDSESSDDASDTRIPINVPNRAHHASLLQSSLDALPSSKPRIMTGLTSPHDILHHVVHTGIDLFDSSWAQQAADCLG